MTSFIDSLSPKFVKNTIALCGSKGERWLARLPDVILLLEGKWSIKAEKHFNNLSYNYVAPATAADGTRVVVKIGLPLNDVEIFGEAKYLGLLNGDGRVSLLNEDQERHAILIERASPGDDLKAVFRDREDEAVPAAIETLKRLSRRPPKDTTHLIKLDDWFDGLRRAVTTDFPAGYATKALDFYAELSSDREDIYLLHGDLHHENILSAIREPYLAIDPKGIVGHIGYELAVFLNNHHWWLDGKTDVEKRLEKAVGNYSAAFGLDPTDIRKWAFCQMVLSWWWTYDEMPGSGRDELGLSDIWNV